MAVRTGAHTHPFQTLPEDALVRIIKGLFKTDLFGICVRTPDLKFFDANDAFLELVGYSRIEAEHLAWMDVMHPDEISYERNMLLRISRGEIPGYRRIKRYVRKDGSIVWADVVIASTNDVHGRVEFFYAFTRAVEARHVRAVATEDERLNITRSLITALRSQNTRLQDFAQIVSHNVRQPVGNLRELIKIHAGSADEVDKDDLVDQMRQIVDGLTESIDVLSRTIRVHQGIGLVYDACNVQVIHDRVCATIMREIAVAGAVITSDFSASPTIRFPESYLESIMFNLITNAIKYRDESRPLRIHVLIYLQQGVPVMQVADNGKGIDLHRYGSRLFGLWQTFHDNMDSRGIGLYMTRMMLESQGGAIDCSSEPGKGSVFSVRFAVRPSDDELS